MKLQRTNAFDLLNYLLLTFVGVVTFYPFWSIFVVSLSTPRAYYSDVFHLFPSEISLEAYQYNIANPQVFWSFLTSAFVTVCGTSFSMLLTAMTGYFLSKSDIKGRRFIFRMFVITMFIGGGLVPTYILISRLGMRNTLLALFVPLAINNYFLILMKNYLQGMPASLEESARMDGANEFGILFRVILPTATPILATISLFYAVQFWNDWFHPMIYLNRPTLYPLSLYLRNMISEATSAIDQGVVDTQVPATIRAAVIIITITPIILVYPFLQRHFVQGVMLGSVKG